MADRIMVLAETTAARQHGLRERQLGSDIEDRRAGRMEARIGQFLAFGIATVFAFLGAYVAVHGESVGVQIGGGIIGSTPLVGLVTAFIIGRSKTANVDEGK